MQKMLRITFPKPRVQKRFYRRLISYVLCFIFYNTIHLNQVVRTIFLYIKSHINFHSGAFRLPLRSFSGISVSQYIFRSRLYYVGISMQDRHKHNKYLIVQQSWAAIDNYMFRPSGGHHQVVLLKLKLIQHLTTHPHILY